MMKIVFDDYFDEILFREGLNYVYYDDPEHPEISKMINAEIDKLRKEYNG